MKLLHIAAIVGVGAVICAAPFVVEATPPSGISQVLNPRQGSSS